MGRGGPRWILLVGGPSDGQEFLESAFCGALDVIQTSTAASTPGMLMVHEYQVTLQYIRKDDVWKSKRRLARYLRTLPEAVPVPPSAPLDMHAHDASSLQRPGECGSAA